MYETTASSKDIARAALTNWEPHGVTLAGYSQAACTHTHRLFAGVGFGSGRGVFPHVPALPLPVVSSVFNAAQERCLYIEIRRATGLCSYIRRKYKKKRETRYWVHPVLTVQYLSHKQGLLN